MAQTTAKNMLNEKALLASLRLSAFSGKRTDKRITAEVEAQHNTKRGVLRAVKTLLPEEASESIRKLHQEVRDYFYKNTVVWGEEGERLLASVHYLEFAGKMREFRDQHNSEVRVFCNNYLSYVASARIALNGAFNEADYPGPSVIDRKFGFDIDYKPVPDAGDFRISIMREAMDEVRDSVTRRVEEATKLAKFDVAKRITDALSNMVSRLSDPDAIFRDSLVGNLRDIANLIPALNVTNDEALIEARACINQALNGIEPQILRDNKAVRASTAEKAQLILNQMSDYMGGIQ